jgi:probable addiction module antidote protein
MAKTKTTPYDLAEHLRTPEERAAYLQATLEDCNGDVQEVMQALGDIARSEGMTHVARESGLSRESLYKALSGDRNPNFDTIYKVMAALGLQLNIVAKAS